MAPEDQAKVIAFLSGPEAYAGRVTAAPGESGVERIDTHISVVWLVADRVYKLKRAVHYDYVDFSSAERRRRACEAEVRLNRRTAPSLYLGVLPITHEADGTLALAGAGTAVDWVVEMVRFDEDTLFDRLAARHQLDAGLMEGLADAIVRLHDGADRRSDFGGERGMAWVVNGNASGFAGQGAGVLDINACDTVTAEARRALEMHAQRLDARRERGLVRECHGDLHLRNICLLEGIPTLFDAVEFNEDISCIDVLYDVAFLLMDLWHRDLRTHANLVFNEYLTRTGDFDDLAVLPLFLSSRAAVRAKTSATAATLQGDGGEGGALRDAAREYLQLARSLLRPPAPCLIAVGGWSGSGKSTLARGLAPFIGAAPGALLLRSDLIRKEIAGVAPLARLGPDGYTAAVNSRVYETMNERARAAVSAGHSVVADAVYARPADREAIARIAREAGAPFVGLWLEGPPPLLAARLRGRVNDASDATPEVLERQMRGEAGPLAWDRVDGSGDAVDVQRAAAALIVRRAPLAVRFP